GRRPLRGGRIRARRPPPHDPAGTALRGRRGGSGRNAGPAAQTPEPAIPPGHGGRFAHGGRALPVSQRQGVGGRGWGVGTARSLGRTPVLMFEGLQAARSYILVGHLRNEPRCPERPETRHPTPDTLPLRNFLPRSIVKRVC